MFICPKCEVSSLSVNGKSYPFGSSQGPCELCGKVAICKDVPSSADWAWQSHATGKAKARVKKHGWTYAAHKATLEFNGRAFAMVTPDGKSPLSEKDQKTLLEALNSKP